MPNSCSIEELTNSKRVGEWRRMLTEREWMHTVDSYTTTERDKTRGIERLLLSSGEYKSLDLAVRGSRITPMTTTATK